MITRSIAILAACCALVACKNEPSSSESKEPPPTAVPVKPIDAAAAPTATPTTGAPTTPEDAGAAEATTDGGAAATPSQLDPSKDTYRRTQAQIALLEEQIDLAIQMVKAAKTEEKRADARDRVSGLSQLRDQLKAELKKMTPPK